MLQRENGSRLTVTLVSYNATPIAIYRSSSKLQTIICKERLRYLKTLKVFFTVSIKIENIFV